MRSFFGASRCCLLFVRPFACFTCVDLVLGLLCISYGWHGQIKFYNRVRVDVGMYRCVIQMDFLLRDIYYTFRLVMWLVEAVTLPPSTKS